MGDQERFLADPTRIEEDRIKQSQRNLMATQTNLKEKIVEKGKYICMRGRARMYFIEKTRLHKSIKINKATIS